MPEKERPGRVFKLGGVVNPKGGRTRATPAGTVDWVSRVVCRIGKAAGVVVDWRTKRDRKTGEPVEKIKYASVDDFRRSYGQRWAKRIMPSDLRALMRHASIETTLRY